VRALLRYSLLKTRRDGSIWVFTAVPAMVACSVLIGGSLSHGLAEFHYPFVMERGWSAARNAREVMVVETLMCAMLAAVLSFSVLRGEIATRSISSLALAVRPGLIAATLVIFAACAAIVAWVVGLILVMVLTAAVPSGIGTLAVKVAIGALATASAGALCVTISPEPPMIIGAFVSTFVFVPGFERRAITPVLLVPVAAAVIATVIAAFVLERRCAR
jgi:hypothetical protein